jgi:hypothetical protein
VNRTLPFFVVALYPLAVLAILWVVPEGSTNAPFPFPQTEFFVKYWWLVLGGALIAQMIFVSVHTLRNPSMDAKRRFFWVFVIVCFPYFSIPIYWWTYSKREA